MRANGFIGSFLSYEPRALKKSREIIIARVGGDQMKNAILLLAFTLSAVLFFSHLSVAQTMPRTNQAGSPQFGLSSGMLQQGHTPPQIAKQVANPAEHQKKVVTAINPKDIKIDPSRLRASRPVMTGRVHQFKSIGLRLQQTPTHPVTPVLVNSAVPSVGTKTLATMTSSDTTWNPSSGPVVLTATFTVPSGDTLTIKPGTIVKLDSGASLIVQGTLIANGRADSLIWFTSNELSPAKGDWGSIEFDNTAQVGSVFNYCVVEYGGGASSGGNIFYKTGAYGVNLMNCAIRYSISEGINVRASSPTIDSCSIVSNTDFGVFSDLFTNFLLENSNITHNGNGVRVPINSSPSVIECVVDSNSQDGLYIDNSAHPLIQNCDIKRNLHDGIFDAGVGSTQPRILENNIEGNAYFGVECWGSTWLNAYHNWWGSKLGPYDAVYNPTGSGDAVSWGVSYASWTSDTTLPVTQITSDISGTITWYSGNVYWIKNTVSLTNGSSLVIQSGVIVKFGRGAYLNFNGSVSAAGDALNPIVFTSEKDDSYGGDSNGDSTSSEPQAGDWSGLSFSSSVSLSNVVVRFHSEYVDLLSSTGQSIDGLYVNNGSYYGVVTYATDNPVYKHLYISGNTYAGLYSNSSNTQFSLLDANIIGNHDKGIYLLSGASLVSMDSSVVMGNWNYGLGIYNSTHNQSFTSSSIVNNGLGGIDVAATKGNLTILGDTVANNGTDGLFLYSADPYTYPLTIGNNIVSANKGDGIITSHATLMNNLMQQNRYGLAYVGAPSSSFSGNTFVGNQYNNAIGLRTANGNSQYFSLRNTLSTAFPAGITSITYVAEENIQTSSGDTLVIQPGVTIKFDPDYQYGRNNYDRYYEVDGTLIAQGTPTQPIVFTSYRDASFGGHTNIPSDNSAPAPGDWNFIRFNGSSAANSVLSYCQFLYGGLNDYTYGNGNLVFQGCNISGSMTNVISRHSASDGVLVNSSKLVFVNAEVDSNTQAGVSTYINSNNADITVRTSTIQDNGGNGLETQLNGYTSSYANAYREVSNSIIRRNGQWGISIQNGGFPESFVGDSITQNGWDGISNESSAVADTNVQYIGNIVDRNGGDGIVSSGARFVDNTITRNRYPIVAMGRTHNIYVDASGVDGNIITGNQYNNAIGIKNGSGLCDTLLATFPLAITSKTYVIEENVQTNSGNVLVIQPGVIVKFSTINYSGQVSPMHYEVDGTLIAQGTPTQPIVFTSYRDASFGGHTNLPSDNSVPSPGDWNYVHFNGSSAASSVLSYCQFRYGGNDSQYGDLYFDGCNVTAPITNVVSRHSKSAGIMVNSARLVFVNAEIDSNAQAGISTYYGYGSSNADITVRASTIQDNGGNGLETQYYSSLFTNAYREVSNSIIRRNVGDGLYVLDATIPVSIIGNTISNNGWDGIYVKNWSNSIDTMLVIAGNKILNNWRGGIFSSRALIENDSIAGNQYPIGVIGELSLAGTSTANGNYYSDNYIANNHYNGVIGTENSIQGVLGGTFPQSDTTHVISVLSSITVDQNSALQIFRGTILKFNGNYSFNVNGVLNAWGTNVKKVIFTAWTDDSYGGDSNGDTTASVPSSNSWNGIDLQTQSGDTSSIVNAIVRYASNGLYVNSNGCVIDSSLIANCSASGITINGSSPTIINNDIEYDNWGIYASYGNSNPLISGNSILNNSNGLYNQSSGIITAQNNYWGSTSGPYVNQGSDQNLSGTGNPINVGHGVIYRPFLTARNGVLIGDVSGNGTITPYDASLVLQYVVGADTSLAPAQINAADVSGDGTVSAYDASLILQYSVGLISAFPRLGKIEGKSNLASIFSLRLEPGPETDQVDLVFHVSGANNVYSTQFALSFDSNQVVPVSSLTTDATQGMTIIWHGWQDSLRVALAGTTATSGDSDWVRIRFKAFGNPGSLTSSMFHITSLLLNEQKVTTAANNNDGKTLPTSYALYQNYPNPFNPSTTIQYDLPKTSLVKVAIYNLLGQEISVLVNGQQTAGRYSVVWNPASAATGVYYYVIDATANGKEELRSVKKMLYLK